MILEYKEIEYLQNIVIISCEEIVKDTCKENYILAFNISIENLNKNKLLDVETEASEWGSEVCPKHFFFNHGQFREGGLEHISNELKVKKTSNRALYSLLDQKKIIKSGDKPIPSFMVFQCLLSEDNSILSVAVYFRALEISNFLKINLEEIRQNIIKIYENNVKFESVNLLIIAGRAHHSPGQIPLKRAEIDLLEQLPLFRLLQSNRAKIRDMLIEKSEIQSVIEFRSLELLKGCLEDQKIDNGLINKLNKIIYLYKELKKLRKVDTHTSQISDKNIEIKKELINLSEDIYSLESNLFEKTCVTK